MALYDDLKVKQANDILFGGGVGSLNPDDGLMSGLGQRPTGFNQQPAKAPDRTWGEVATDTGAGIMQGFATLGGDLAWIGDKATGGAVDLGIQKAAERATEYWQDQKSDSLKQATQNLGSAEGFTGTLKAAWDNPEVVPDILASSLPYMLPTGIAGRAAAVAKGAGAGAKAVMGTTGLLEGANAGRETENKVRDMTAEKLSEVSPQYLQLIQSGMSHEDAAAQIANRAGLTAAAVSAPLAMLASKVTGAGKLEADFFTGQGLKGFFDTVLRESAEEMAQEASNPFGSNVGIKTQVNPDQSLSEGVPEGAALGLIAGAGQGAPMSALQNFVPPVKQPGAQGGIDSGLIQPTPTPDNPAPAPVERPDPSNGPISAAAAQMAPVQTAADLGVQFPEQQDWSQYDKPAAQRGIETDRGYEGLDGLITTTERMGFTDEAAQLITARRLFQQAEQARAAGDEVLAGQFAERGNRLYQSATETNDQIRTAADQFPVPYVATGEVAGGEVGPYQGGTPRTGETFDQPRRMADPTPGLLEQRQDNRLTDQGIIYGEEPAGVRTAREQRAADDFSARYGQEGRTPLQSDPVREGDFIQSGTITDESRRLPNQYQRPAQLEDNRMGALPPGTGQIDMGRDRPERTFTPTPTEYEDVGRNVVERQAGADTLRLENRKTITQGEMIELTRQFREAVTTKPANRTDEQRQIIKAVPKLKKQVNAGEVQVTQNLQSDLDPQPAGQQIDIGQERDNTTPASTLDDRENMLAAEASEIRASGKRPADQTDVERLVLEASTATVIDPSSPETFTSLSEAIERGRLDVAEVIVGRAKRYAENMSTTPGVSESDPRYTEIQADLERRKQQALMNAERLQEALSNGRAQQPARVTEEPAPQASPELRMKANGKPFASESAAKRSMPYKQNAEFAEVVPVDGGFAVRVNEQAQNETETRALELSEQRSQAAKKHMFRPVDTIKDDMLDAIALYGGINRAEAEGQGIDPDNFKRQAAGVRWVFPANGGDTFDGMAEALAQDGYLDPNAERLDDLRAKLDQAINQGRKIMTPEGYEALAEKEAAAEAQLQQEHEPTIDGATRDEEWLIEAYAMAQDSGVPTQVIDTILNQYQGDAILMLVELNDAIEQARTATRATGRNQEGRRTAPAEAFGTSEILTPEAAAEIWGSVDPEPLLSSYTESDLQAQADAQSAAEQTEADVQRRAEQKAQADAEVNDFSLTGSNRPADVAAAAGQNDMFGLGGTPRAEQPAPQQAEPEPQPIESAIDAVDDLNKRINKGEAVTADEVRRVFEYVAGNQDAVKAELNKLKKDELKRLVSGHVWSDTKKAELVDRAYDSLIGDFRFIGNESGVVTSTGFGAENRLNQAREHVNALTDEQVAEYAKNRKAMIDERMAERKQRIEALKNPQTLQEYRESIRILGMDKLTPEQRATYDRLVAEETMAQRQPQSERAGLQADDQVELGEPTEGTHGKTGETIYNVKVITRLGKDKFKEAAAFARSMGGGYYRGNFYFKSREDAELFSGWVNGESVDLSERNQQRQEQKQANAADKLKAMADRIEQQANEALNADRKENTAKRMREADSARANAAKDARLAEIMRRVADSDSPLLKGMTQKVQVELMEKLARSLKYNAPRDMTETDSNGDLRFKDEISDEMRVADARMPIVDMYSSVASDLANSMIKTKGFVLHGRRLAKQVKDTKTNMVALDSTLAEKVVSYIEAHSGKYATDRDTAADFKRLQRMGITNRPTLRAALLEYMRVSQGAGQPAQQNRLQTLERDLQRTMVGNRNAFNDFFPTPEAVAEEVVAQAEIEPGMRVLEPSAGNGMLADAAKAAGAEVDVVEMGGQLREILSEKGYTLVGDDFLEYQAGEQYDRIVMNPPFSKDQDIEHVNHAYDQLKPGGKLVAIVSSMAGDRANTRNRQFREWLDSLDAVEQPLPQGAFLSSMNQTGVNTKVLVIEKPMRDTETAPQAEASDSNGSTVTANGVTIEVPTIDQQLVDDYNRAAHMGRGRDLNAELRSEAEGLLNELSERQYTLDTPEQRVEAKRLIEAYLQAQAEFSQWDARYSASNPSWIVTGRSGRNMDRANRSNERHMDEYTKRVDRLQAQRDRIGDTLYKMRPQEVQENQALSADLRNITQQAGHILGYLEEGKNALVAETRKWTSPKAHKLIERSLEADRGRTIEHIRELENTKAVQDAGGLAKVFGPRSKAGKLVTELLDEQAPQFSRSTTSVTGTPLSVADLDSVFNRIAPRLKSGQGYRIFESVRDLFAAHPEIAQEARKQGSNGSDIEGVFHKGQVLIVRNKVTSEAQAEALMFHEATHGGVNAMMADEGVTKAANRLFTAMGGGRGFVQHMERLGLQDKLKPYIKGSMEKGKDGKLVMTQEERRAMLVHELLAFTGEKNSKGIKQKARELIGAIRQWLRKHGYLASSELSTAEISYMARQARRYALGGKAGKAGAPRFMVAYHGTPHRFDKFSLDAIGTGEGAQAYGWGLYFAGNSDVARYYQNALSQSSSSVMDAMEKNGINDIQGDTYVQDMLRGHDFELEPVVTVLKDHVRSLKNRRGFRHKRDIPDFEAAIGRMESLIRGGHKRLPDLGNFYQVDIPKESDLLDYDAPLDRQGSITDSVRAVTDAHHGAGTFDAYAEANDGGDYRDWKDNLMEELEDREISLALGANGVPGLMYFDGDSRIESADGRTRNYVIWDESVVSVQAVNDELVQAEMASGTDTAPMFRRSEDAEPELSAALRAQRTLGNNDRNVWDKVKRTFKRNFTAAGLLPDSVFREKVLRDSEVNAHEFDTAHYIGALDRAISKAYGTPYRKLTDAQREAIDAQMKSTEPDMSIPEPVRVALMDMRRSITGLSVQYAEILQQQVEELQAQGNNADAMEKAALLETIISNMDTYAHRSYRAFDDPDWPAKVSKDPEIWPQAVEYLKARQMEQGMPEAEAEQQAIRIARTILEEGTAYEDMSSLIKESKLGAKDLSTLKRRKDIAPEIRALLGEYKDVKINYAKTLSKMSRLVANTKLLDRIKEIGLSEGWLFTEDNKPLDQSVTKVAGDASEVYAPLNGYYVPNEINQALIDTLGKEQMADWLRAVIRMNGMVKYGKTVLSPTTAFRNWMSAAFFAMANGHFDITQMRKSISGFSEYFGHGENPEKVAYLRKLKELGVVYDTAYAGEMMDLLADAKGGWAERLFEKPGLSSLKAANELAQKFYQYGDDFWKIMGFENEKAMLMKHKGMSEAEAEVEAAERIRNTYPTYSMTGRAVNWLRRFPLAGTFVSFPAEVIRTQFHMLRYLKQDWKDSPAYAARKVVGLAMVSGLAYAAQALSKDLFDIGDDEEEAVRLMAASWNSNSNIWFMGRDENGNIRYLDFSFLDPYNYFKRPINAVMRDQPLDKAAIQAAGEMLTPFFGTDIAFGAISEIWNNKKEGGGRVYNPQDMALDQAQSIANHLRKAIQPGFVGNMERAWMAANDQVTASGKQYKAEEELAAFFGFRASTFDPKTALYYNSFEFKDRKRDATAVLMNVAKDPNSVSDGDLMRAYDTASRSRLRAYTDMIRLVQAAKAAGMNNMQVNASLRRSGISKADIRALMQGRIPAWRPDQSMMRNTIRKAELLYGPEVVREMRERERAIIQRGYRE